MRTHILGTGLILGLALTVVGGPVAWAADTDNGENAADTGNNAVAPFLAAPDGPLAPGQEIHLRGYCPDPAAGPVTSDVLTGIEVLHDPQSGPPNLNASGVVADGTAPGNYTAAMSCADYALTTTFTVVEPGDPTHDLPADFVRVHPAAAYPGDPVAAQASCDADEATLSSPVLRTVTLAPDPEGHQPWALHGATTVNEDAEPGEHPVTAQCADAVLETTITVLDPSAEDTGQTGSDQADADADDGAGAGQVSRVPRGAPETGDGTEHTAAGQMSLSTLVLGLALGAAAGAGAIAWREVRR